MARLERDRIHKRTTPLIRRMVDRGLLVADGRFYVLTSYGITVAAELYNAEAA